MSTAVLSCRPAAAATTPLLPLVGADTAVPLVPAGTARYVDLDAAASSRALNGDQRVARSAGSVRVVSTASCLDESIMSPSLW